MERTPWKWNKRKSSSNPCPKPPALISRKFLKRQKLNQQLEKWHAPINWQKWLLILPKLSLEYWSLHNLRLMFSQCKSYDPHTFTVVCVSFNCDVQYRNVMNHFPCYQADSIHGCSYNWLCLFFFVCFVLSKKMRDKLRMRSPGSSTVWKRKIWKQIHWMKVISSDQAECQGFSFGWATVILARPHDNTALCFSFLSFSLSFF